jgi:pimeloyl-ACP methyl ester carboxylesterase
MQVIVDKLLTSYEKTGKGPTILLLHGWGDSHITFNSLARDLQRKYTIISLDLPGFGGSQPPNQAWGLDDYCDFVAKFLKKIGHEKLYAVIGHSNGGSIAIRGLANDSLKSDKLVLISSAGIRDVYKGRKKILRIAAKAAKAATSPLPKSAKNKLKRGAYQAIGSDMFVAEHLQETFKKIVIDDVRADAARLKLPTLLIYGADDKATPPAYGEMYQDAISGSMLQIVDDGGHFVHHDKPEAVSEFIMEFLK